jgi:hypothetical protein
VCNLNALAHWVALSRQILDEAHKGYLQRHTTKCAHGVCGDWSSSADSGRVPFGSSILSIDRTCMDRQHLRSKSKGGGPIF